MQDFVHQLYGRLVTEDAALRSGGCATAGKASGVRIRAGANCCLRGGRGKGVPSSSRVRPHLHIDLHLYIYQEIQPNPISLVPK